MPRILFRHIVADLCRIMLLTAAVLVSVIAFGAAIRPIMQNLLGADDVLQYVGLASVPMLQFALPFAGAFAGTIVYARLAADNEILAMSAAGLSYRKVLLPAAALGVVLLLGMAVLVDVGVPRFWTSMRRLVTRDPTKLFLSAVERGEAFVVPGTGTQLYADEARLVPVEAAPGAPVTRLALAGVAAIELDPSGRPTTEFTAEFATVDIYRENDSAFLKLLFRNATAYREGEDALVYVPLAEPEAIDLGKGIRLTPKDFDLRGLLAIWGDIDAYHAV
ncbi:MAG: LptF/LptG family permease, partial [Planctomycetaceae bacterium]|nr:LptF/LptG family permease [Planctomycetaceae bacterium]